jgi:hypothetical protein
MSLIQRLAHFFYEKNFQIFLLHQIQIGKNQIKDLA